MKYRINRSHVALFALLATSTACSLGGAQPEATPKPAKVVIIVPNSTVSNATAVAALPTTSIPTSTSTTTLMSTNTPIKFVSTATFTYTPSVTYTPSITGTPTDTPTASATPLPSNTPTAGPTFPPIDAKICDACIKARLRESPGTAGKILGWVEKPAEFSIVGRTADSKWVEIVLKKNNKHGWISTQYVAASGNFQVMNVSGIAVEATDTPTHVNGTPLVVSNITSHARDIFLKGQGMGNRANVFSRVGDSITASPYFLTNYGTGNYNLGDYNNELTDVVHYFGGANARTGNSFANASLAAGNGWGADRIIQPGWAYQDVCGNDSPLVCEYKHVHPAVALIMIGTNDSGGISPEAYVANLSQIVQISIDYGVVPVLCTIPPKTNDDWNNQRGLQWNGLIKQVAHQYDVPLWDYWYAVQKLPNQGIGPDGIHPSLPPIGSPFDFTGDNLNYGYTMRNLTALQVLNDIWRLVLY